MIDAAPSDPVLSPGADVDSLPGRGQRPAIARRTPVAAGLASALAVLAAGLLAPIGWLERIAYELYLDIVTPLAAAPLGQTARLLMAATAALVAGLVVWRLLSSLRSGTLGALVARRRHRAARARAAHETLRADDGEAPDWSGTATDARAAGIDPPPAEAALPPEAAAPVLRRADAHPDAPSRAPLRPDRDLALPAIPPAVPGERPLAVSSAASHEPAADFTEDEPLLLDAAAMVPVGNDPPMPDQSVLDLSEADRLDANDPAAPWLAPAALPAQARGAPPADAVLSPVDAGPAPVTDPSASSAEPSLPLLLARLEAGMAARAALLSADRSIDSRGGEEGDAAPAPNTTPTSRDTPRDPALDAALSTLRRLTQGAR